MTAMELLETLQAQAAQMLEYAESGAYDREDAHMNADDLLINALRTLAEYRDALNQQHTEQVNLLITHYQNVPKWFA